MMVEVPVAADLVTEVKEMAPDQEWGDWASGLAGDLATNPEFALR
jgi:hypothetical protein